MARKPGSKNKPKVSDDGLEKVGSDESSEEGLEVGPGQSDYVVMVHDHNDDLAKHPKFAKFKSQGEK